MNVSFKLNPNKTIGFIILVIFSLLIYIPLNFLLSHGYKSYLDFIFSDGRKDLRIQLLQSQTGKYIFEGLKVFPFIVFAWLILVWINFFRGKQKKITKLFMKIADGIYNSINENKNYLFRLAKADRIAFLLALGIQLIAYSYFLYVMPLNYDEWTSYRCFSGKSFWHTLSDYPIPNNHVFFNLVSGFFVRLPFDSEITVRIPSLIASLIASYYFFKVCKYCFNNSLALILIVFVITTYPLIVFSFQARGYAFTNLFCVLLIYTSIKLVESYKNKKYRYLLILSVFLGLFSVPSFAYVILPVVFVLGIYLLKQKRLSEFLLFVKDGVISVILVIIGYSFVLMFNNPDNLLNPNGGVTKFKLSDPGAFINIINHLKETWAYLLYDEKFILIISILVLISAFVYIYRMRGTHRYLCVVAAAMFFSPLFIILVHKVIPFPRTWLYLIYPIALCFGFMIKNGFDLLSKKFHNIYIYIYKRKAYVHSLTLLICVILLCLFSSKHNRISHFDFELKALRERDINPVISNIKSIAFTKAGYEFYIADIVYGICYKNDRKRWVDIGQLDSIKDQDIIVIERSQLHKFSKDLKKYKFLQYLNGNIFVYGKPTLFRDGH